MSPLESAPNEIIEEIAFHVALLSFLGPPAALPAFLCASKRINTVVSRENNPRLYARIFTSKFDVAAPRRRLNVINTHDLPDELIRRCLVLQRIRRNAYPRPLAAGDPDNGDLREDMWTAYIMFLESEGHNARQLIEYARVDRFARDFVHTGGRLHDGAHENEGWVVDSEINALGMWLFWFTDNERVRLETPAERDDVLAALFALYAASFKYAPTHAPLTFFLIPPPHVPQLPPSLSILPFSVAPIHPPCIVPDYFGFELTLARPLLVPPVLLSYTVRFEQYSSHLSNEHGWVPPGSRAPATRAEREATGWEGPTGEDFEAFSKVKTGTVEWGDDASTLHEQDWMRLRTCYDPWNTVAYRDRVFIPGMLDGVWEGRWLALQPPSFQALLHSAETGERPRAPVVPHDIEAPLQFRIREHHQHDREQTLDFDDITMDGIGSGALNAWLPDDIGLTETAGKLRVYDSSSRQTMMEYTTYDPLNVVLDEEMQHVGYYGGGVWDIILTAETLPEFGKAWGNIRYKGRVRDWDGLVVLLRETPEMGQWVFRGYVHGGKNLVGRWRETATQVDAPGWEGTWSMMKIE